MKLLLTSGGITNNSISQGLQNLTGMSVKDIKIGFIPTAANGEPGKKDWYIKPIIDLLKFEYEWIDFVDFSASNVDWENRLAECNVIFISGGNTFHLLNETKRHGFDKWINNNLDKLFVGISAGSILFTPTIEIATVEPADINYINLTNLKGLGLVNFEISPHSPELLTYKSNENYAKVSETNLYAIDDNTAIEVVDKKITIISEGEWRRFDYTSAKFS